MDRTGVQLSSSFETRYPLHLRRYRVLGGNPGRCLLLGCGLLLPLPLLSALILLLLIGLSWRA